ncbi:MAG: hypothetical protein A3G23_11210 [Bacteroidetes bacterium RIFCSPLOWO2_12_FULL_37_12]|nr:MAG: hypothetical protein A3G23_11210 [Bacteroidetes bacterium RIFCSPLOWO2_12_FULL_37_12]
MEKKFLKLDDVKAYKIAFNLSNYVWDVVIHWEGFAKWHLGGQFVDAIDSISANIAEGFGRYHKKDKIKFYRYSQGSLKESFDWNEKSKIRKLLSEKQYNKIFGDLQKLPQEINYLINITNQKLSL